MSRGRAGVLACRAGHPFDRCVECANEGFSPKRLFVPREAEHGRRDARLTRIRMHLAIQTRPLRSPEVTGARRFCSVSLLPELMTPPLGSSSFDRCSPFRTPPRWLCSRGVVFLLASLSFACLLGQFYGLWSMRCFACAVLPPSTAALAWVGWRAPRAAARTWVVQGGVGGLVAAAAYDLYRLPFVVFHVAPLFKVFGRFGELIVGSADAPAWLTQTVGWTYHFSNGAALGIMFLALLVPPANPGRFRRWLFWGAVGWALTVEAILLATPYPSFFGLPLDGRFVFLTASAHLIFGLTLGAWCARRVLRATLADNHY